ncbi:MAG: phosphatase PAP2 family protein [Lachnospiraceae bacterium]|nr:phosphatase PAP2 family protein [Lachnospiraceae bacterium]
MDFLRFLAEYRIPAGDFFFQLVTYLAQEILVIGFVCWFFWSGNKNLAYKLGFSYFLSGLTIQGLKITFRIPRPWVLDPNFKAVDSALPAATGYSFPSGHTQSGTSFFTTLAWQTKRSLWRILCVIGFLLIGFSRMYLGVHTPKDVFTSMILTFLITSMVCSQWKHLENDKSHDLLIAVLLTLIVAALIVYDIILLQNNILDEKNASDCLKACGAGLAFGAGFYLERRYINFTVPTTTRDKILRFTLGIAGVALIEFGGKALLPSLLVFSCIRYFVIVLWILVLYPLLFTKLEKKNRR